MTNEQAREVQVPLDFLGSGTYHLAGLVDGVKPTDVRRLTETVTGGRLLTTGRRNGADHLSIKLASGGGCVLRFEP